jgi:hypothetical protein
MPLHTIHLTSLLGDEVSSFAHGLTPITHILKRLEDQSIQTS